MPQVLKLHIIKQEAVVHTADLTTPLELGRQQEGEPGPYTSVPVAGQSLRRLILASGQENNLSRRHVLLEPLASGHVQVTNRSRITLPCVTAPGGAVAAGATVELAPPFALSLPGRSAVVEASDSVDASGLHSLDRLTIGPGQVGDISSRMHSLSSISGPHLQEMVGWLQTTMGVLQATVGAADFLEKATAALVQIVGLDIGRMLLLEGEQWRGVAAYGAGPSGNLWQPSRYVLAQVREKKMTFWQTPRQVATADAPSLGPLQTVVAAPILDAEGNVIGALYGERRWAAAFPQLLHNKLEAMLVEMLACGVATGMARQAHEKAALQAQVRFEQFFGPDLARQLAKEPNLLDGREACVTLLFCDVRGFSRFSEKLGPAQTVRWINDIMGELSQHVLDQQGVLVDYVGDELMAMWGAPRDQADQEVRAVRAGLGMLAALPAVNQRWQTELGGPVEVGIGLNTGLAQVGNTGSKQKFKYGPLGDTVNLASRVQGLTKHLKRPLLITRATREQLGPDFLARRVVKARVFNIEKPVDLFEVAAAGSEQQQVFFAESEAALDALEAGDFASAARRAGTLLLEHHGDGPLLLILARASNALMQEGQGFLPTWESPGK